MPSQTVTIDSRFNGPPGSGNGGYVCGLLAAKISGPSEATLRVPPPLEHPLTLSWDETHAELRDGETLVGEAHAVSFDLTPPAPPSFAEAEAAQARYLGHADHRYPTCFVCGTARTPADGLDLFTGPVAQRDMVACTWRPSADLAGADGQVREEFIHAALDCPSYWSLTHAGKPALLARLTASITAPLPEAGAPLIVAAWPLSSEGRKHRAASALFHADGRLIARAQALWIEPRA